MWRYVVAVGLILGLPLVGAYVGATIGERVCRDDEDAILRCMDETLSGAALGGFVGLIVLVVVAVALALRGT